MATTATATPRPTNPNAPNPKARPVSMLSPSPQALTRSTSTRSAIPPRVNSPLSTPVRRASLRNTAAPNLNGITSAAGESKDVLNASLKRETDLKEQLLVQLENKEQSIIALTKENDKLTSSLKTAETRLGELYADQSRAEEELNARIELVEKLRTQVKELEKEKRDIQRRYNEQTSSFEAERQSFYDNEQHLKSRIQGLTQARRQPAPPRSPSLAPEPDTETEDEYDDPEPEPEPETDDSDSDPPEMVALKLELSTLSTSYSSMQNTLILIQTQLVDLKRVNNELQEENESYNILLTERTLNGQYDPMKRMGGSSSSSMSDDDEVDSDSAISNQGARSLRHSSSRSTLDPVEETPEDEDNCLKFEMDNADSSSQRKNRKHGASPSVGGGPVGDSLAAEVARGGQGGLSGPGLDLAAELGRAQNKDPDSVDIDTAATDKRSKKQRKGLDAVVGKEPGTDLDHLRSEVKALKDANKALSLYASKIIDRIISQEGFEHVLSVDYEKEASQSKTPALTTFQNKGGRPNLTVNSQLKPGVRAGGPMTSPIERLTTFESLNAPLKVPEPDKSSRRSMSFDWSSFSIFGSSEKKQQQAQSQDNLKPLNLKPGKAVARKLDTEEDDEDRRERERLAATMRLMGIEKPAPAPAPIPLPSPVVENMKPSLPASNSTRFSFFRRSSVSVTPDHSSRSSPAASQPNLTQEALEQAEAEESLAALDARERDLSVEMAKGYGGGFTEIKRVDRRSRRSQGGSSGSTVWSAGMSKVSDDD